ncbi:MAG: xanthine dehydrogenase family protein molybdopterin-binding subunit [Nitrososphaerales archaeon]
MAQRFVGTPIKRREDPRLITGYGKFVDDIKLPNMVYAEFVRSPYAHAKIKGIDVSECKKHAGVLLVVTAKDLEDRLRPLPQVKVEGVKEFNYMPLAKDKVRFVGEPVAALVAIDRYTAADAVELVKVDYEPLKAVSNVEEAIKPDAPILHEEWGSNIAYHKVEFNIGDVDKVSKEADIIVKEKIKLNRTVSAPIEPRALIADYDPSQETLTLYHQSQHPHAHRTMIAQTLGIPENKLRLIVKDVGGSFGLKAHIFPEDIIVSILSMMLRRPVKWVEDRRTNISASVHDREQVDYIEIAAKKDGTILGIINKCISDIGAYHAPPYAAAPVQSLTNFLLLGPYKIRNFYAEHTSVVTNKGPEGAVRGPGMMQANFLMERAIDLVARTLDLDPADVRKKNIVKSEDLPYKPVTLSWVATADLYYKDVSCFEALEKALKAINYEELKKEQEELRKKGVYRGIGIACLIEPTAFGARFIEPMGVPGYDAASIRIEPDGKVIVLVSSSPHGQSLETTYAQVVADELGVSFEDVHVIYGDTSVTPYGMGTSGSRSGAVGGSTCIVAARKVKEKVLKLASHVLEARIEDLEIKDAKVSVKGVPSRGVTLKELATLALLNSDKLPKGIEAGLEATVRFQCDEPITWSNSTHIAIVDVDAETGQVKLLKYLVVEDCGNMINPLVVEGQVHGGVAHGIGQALYENIVYNEDGQILNPSFMDYLLPSAVEIPDIEVLHVVTPSSTNPGGFKGLGEGGAIVSPAAIANAVEDALEPFGVKVTELPISPERVLKWIKVSKR